MTVIENVVAGGVFGSGRKDISTAREKAREYVDFVGLGGHEDTPVSELTVANRRQVELARSLATDPKLILLDEVATGLNPSEVEEMTDTIDRLRNEYEVSVLWIEHIMDAIMSTVDRVIVLHHGQKIADGTPEEVQQNEAVIEAYFGGEL